MRVVACGLIVVLGWLAPAASSRAAALFTIAGVESTSAFAPAACWSADYCTVPRRWPRTWTATERRLKATCLTHLADGTILVCQGSELLALDGEGRLRHWLPSSGRPGLGWLLDADVAPDGSVVALGTRGAARLRADGSMRTVVSNAGSETSFGSAVAAMPDGGVLLSTASERPDLVRIGPDGTRSVIARALPVGREAEYSTDPFDDLAALPDGSALFAPRGRRRVLHVNAAGRVEIVAGGAGSFMERGRATAVDLGSVTAVAARRDGGALVSADHGVFVVKHDGRLQRVSDGTGYDSESVQARALTTDGQFASKAMLAGVRRLDVLDDGTMLALVASVYDDTRVVAIAPLRQQPRLSVALASSNRRSLRRGHLDVLATRSAEARITITHGDRVLVRTRVSLHAGNNHLRLRVPSRADALVASVRATSSDGSVATHRLAFLTDLWLSSRELHRVRWLVEEEGSLAVNTLSIDGCVRATPRSFRCRWEDWSEGELVERGRAAISLSQDGLVRYAGTDDAERYQTRLVFEPL